MTLEEWISRFDNEEANKLTQEEQIELKSYLLMLLDLTKTNTWENDVKMKMKMATLWSINREEG